jgi:hypothetical protein
MAEAMTASPARLEFRPMIAFLDMILKWFAQRPAYAYVSVRVNHPRRLRRR